MTNDHRVEPPTVAVADPAVPTPPPRPLAISRAISLSWLSLIAGLPCSVSMSLPTADRDFSLVDVALTVLNYALVVLAIVRIAQGRRWARTLLVTLTGLSLWSVAFIVQLTRLELTSYMLSALLDLGALYLMFAAPGRAWFEAPARVDRPSP